jgi:hypothetical protein
MSTATADTCAGCSAPIEQPKSGRRRKWCSERCRKLTLYSRRCVDCDAVCNTDGRVTGASERCRECAWRLNHETRRWTPETVITAIRRWADEHGGVPPTAADWNPTLASTPRGSEFPSLHTVMHEFGTWKAGIDAAGFDGFKSGHYGREGEDPAVVAETIRLYRSGLSAPTLATAWASPAMRCCIGSGPRASPVARLGDGAPRERQARPT